MDLIAAGVSRSHLNLARSEGLGRPPGETAAIHPMLEIA